MTIILIFATISAFLGLVALLILLARIIQLLQLLGMRLTVLSNKLDVLIQRK